MQYREGSLGRVFVAKIEHGDHLTECIIQIAKKESVKSAVVFMLGALKEASMVVGPEKPEIPPEPVWKEFSDGREIIGIGTLFDSAQGPSLHLHAGTGRINDMNIGCIRKNAEVYIVVEAIILEITGIEAAKTRDDKMELNLLHFI